MDVLWGQPKSCIWGLPQNIMQFVAWIATSVVDVDRARRLFSLQITKITDLVAAVFLTCAQRVLAHRHIFYRQEGFCKVAGTIFF
jgi:hypothetical protein